MLHEIHSRMVDKFQRIFTTTTEGALDEKLLEVLPQIHSNGIVKLAVFCHAASDSEYLENLAAIKQAVDKCFAGHVPLISYIAQHSHPGGLAIEATYVEPDTDIEYHEDYITINNDGCTELITAGILSDDTTKSTFEQSNEVFGKIGKILLLNGFRPSDIYRQWNYIPGITILNDGSQNYQEFNDSRSIFYADSDWSNGYPAATGIGTCAGGVMVELYAVKGVASNNHPIDNPVQIAAHSYSQKVLDGKAIGQLSEKTTPKFERARLFGNTILISGTAAIKGEESNISDDTVVQATETMEIMDRLVATDNIPAPNNGAQYDLLRVYVKRENDIPAVRAYMEQHYSAVAKHYLVADICRPELLIEIEGIVHI